MEFDGPSLVTATIFGFILIQNAFEIYIIMRQIKVYETSRTVPNELRGHMDEETFHRARLYGLHLKKFNLFQLVVMEVIVSFVEIRFGLLANLWQLSGQITALCGWDAQAEITVSCVFLVLLSVVDFLQVLPLRIYQTFWVEEKYGFNKQTALFFASDQLKSLLIAQILMLPIISATIYIVQHGGEQFFMRLWLFTGLLSFFLITICPVCIAPLFYKFIPFPEGPLRSSIEELAASQNFPLTKLYLLEGSARSSHSNAYFYGLWNSKCIVIYDTLLPNRGRVADDPDLREADKGKGVTNEEVVAIVAHELGHWSKNHTLKNICIAEINLLLVFIIFNYSFGYSDLYTAMGFCPDTRGPIIVGMLIVFNYVLVPHNAIFGFLMTALSRHFEHEADEFAHKLGHSQHLANALIKLNVDNLDFPIYDWLYSTWNHSHPTLLERLERLKQLDEAAAAKAN